MQDAPADDPEQTQRVDLDGHDAPTVTPTTAAVRRPAGGAVFERGHVVAGRYRIVRLIARGGMGEVYEAEDLELHDAVALKTIRPEIADDPVTVERFRREIQIARKITHPNVCRVFDVDHDQSSGVDVTFVTMELLAGQTLRELILERGPLSTDAALPIARQIADALTAAHRAGVVHRDLKSANVMLVPEPGQEQPRVVVTDFGLARALVSDDRTVTNSGDIVGSPAYMAPEQIAGGPITPATDIFAFGVLLYELVTRGHPFEAETRIASLMKRLQQPAVSPRAFMPQLDAAWERALLRCVEKEPADRFQDARSVIRALEGEATGVLPSQRRARVRRLGVAFGAVLFLAMLAALLLTRDKAPVKPAEAPRAAAPGRRSVAVIGFRNQSGQPEVAWLSTALTEMLTTEVAAASQVRTVPGEAVARTKRELGLDDSAGIAPAALTKLRNVLGTDYLVSGSYAAVGAPGARQLRLDVQLQEALGGNVVASFAETGTEDGIFDLVSRAGSRLREKLGVASVAPEAASGILASLPSNPKAVRFYAEGLAALHAQDNLQARALLEQAIAADAEFPLAHAALARAWRALGYDSRAKQELQTALRHAAKLPRENRLLIEAQAHGENGRFDQAAEIYLALWRFYPDTLDYAERAAMAQIDGGKGKEALALIESLKKTWTDPRVDLAEADAADAISDYKREHAAALAAIRKAETRGQGLFVARARINEGYALLRMSQLPAARAAFEDAKARYGRAGDRAGVRGALGGIGAVLYENEQFDEALKIFEAEAKISRETGARASEAADLTNIALTLKRKGDLAAAREVLGRALALNRETGEKNRIANTLDILGGVEESAGNLTEAARLYQQALALNEEIGAVKQAANNRNNLAVIHANQGDIAAAERLFQQAMVGYRQVQDDSAVADVLNNLGALQRARGDNAAAEKSYREAEQVYARLGSKSDLALIAVNLATILVDRGDLAEARKKNDSALTIWRGTGEKSYAAYALMGLGDVERLRGDSARADALYREALGERQKMGEASTAAESQLALASLALDRGALPDAEPLARAALATFEKEQRADFAATTHALLCRIATARRDLPIARQHLREAESLARSIADAPSLFAVSLAEARLATASGKPAVAIQKLTALAADSTRRGVMQQQFEARLALAEAQLAAGRAAEARSQRESLEWDANRKGFGYFAAAARSASRSN